MLERRFLERRCKDTMNKLPSPNFFAKKIKKKIEEDNKSHKVTKSHIRVALYFVHYIIILYIIYNEHFTEPTFLCDRVTV